MKITHLGKELPSTEEHEILADPNEFPFGFEIGVVNVDDTTTELHNVTEFHYMYNRHMGNIRDRMAFESDIHGTGITVEINEVKEIEITKSTWKQTNL